MNPRAEWIETDGLGGFAMGCADGIRTRRYHSVLTVATTPPTGRMTLVNGFDATVECADGTYNISSQRYAGDVTHPDGATYLINFTNEPWPTWTYRLPNGLEVIQELVMRHGAPVTALSWRLSEPRADVRLSIRPFFSVRDAHGEAHENAAFNFHARVAGQHIEWQPYEGRPGIAAVTNGDFLPDALWYRNFRYDLEHARGLGDTEDLASPGTIRFNASDRAILIFGSNDAAATPHLRCWALRCWEAIATAERSRRSAFESPLHRAADAYIVRRGDGKTIVAGYPWFSDWGRDTFIALRGLCVAGQRLTDARDILLEWAHHVNEGMLPNFFPEGNAPAEYNSVDASLWYVVAVHDFLDAAEPKGLVTAAQVALLGNAVMAIVDGYARGTRFGIRADGTGLLAAGVPGVQLTWMDAKIGDHVVTPRIGKPVEIQALWINALRVASRWKPRWNELADYAQNAFAEFFWFEEKGYLCDVVDVDHRAGATDTSLRPNQLLAVGGLPWPVVTGDRARRIVEAVQEYLWTPAGPRSLAPTHPAYRGQYGGDMQARDLVYHQGTVWPWLSGAFIEAWIRVHGLTDEVRAEARSRFLTPLLEHYDRTTPGQLAEIADGDAPHAPNGCPFQAWSVGEALRLTVQVLRQSSSEPNNPGRRRSERLVRT
ncbi:MAG: amylo-alpha-1,6-glucosidase [Gemmatimonadaceae bacterium]